MKGKFFSFIDSHVHLGIDQVRIKKKLQPQTQYPDDYIKKVKDAYKKLGIIIENAIVFPFPGSYNGYINENEYIYRICKDNSFFRQFLIIDPSRKSFLELLKKYNSVDGYKIHIASWLSLIYSEKPPSENRKIISEGIEKIMENITERPLLIHPWYQDRIEGKTPIVDIVLNVREKLENKNPIIFAHCAMLNNLERIKEEKDVYIDLSASAFLIQQGPRIYRNFKSPSNLLKFCIEKIGVGKCIWGTDSPFNIGYDTKGYIKEIEYLFKSDLSEADIAYIAKNNIRRLLNG